MSAARVEQLKGLLARVQERRAAPRLRVEPGAQAAARSATSGPEAPSSADAASRAVAHTMLDLRQVPVSMPEPAQAVAPLVLEDMPSRLEPASRKSESPSTTASTVADLPVAPPPPSPVPVARELEPETLPPVALAEPAAEVPLTAPTARVEAPLLARSEPVVRVVSSPRIEAPKNFGDLLEASLSLRPR